MPKLSDQISALNVTLAADEEKFINGNMSAGTRMRKTLQQIKKVCQDGRKEVQESKNDEAKA